ncbi:MAG: DnaA regulatory inactivator Hda [Gammaproteobacteria bacterium]|nr:DnaA regulatory inactivator Hda [Gammaproteobacteria bacterium]
MQGSAQLALAMRIRDDAAFSNYFAGPNQEIVDHLQKASQGKPSDGTIYLSGADGVGKTHLLQAACRQAEKHQGAAVYLPLAELREEDTGVLDGLETLSLICIDDVHEIEGHTQWEAALFHLYNRAFDTGAQIIFAADRSVAALGIQLPDLHSRLAWGFVYKLLALSDEEKVLVLQARARLRGFALPEDVGRYLLRRFPRDMAALQQMLDELDQVSLAAQRGKITIPFVRSWLEHREQSTQVQLF